jgi:transcriptional regulator with XRE-family HTH domain
MNIGENIKKYRLQRGLTQETLAAAVGVSAQAVSKWECADSIPDGMLFIPIADALEISLDRLCGYEKVYEYDTYAAIYKLITASPSDKRMEKAREICWQTQKGLCGPILNEFYPYDFSFTPGETTGKDTHSMVSTDEGFTFISNHSELPFFCLFSEPERGFGSTVRYDEKYLEYLKALSDGYVLKALFALYQKDESVYTFEKEVLASECDIPDDRIDDVMKKLDGLVRFGGESWGIANSYEINGERRMLYTFYPRYQLAALLIVLHAVIYGSTLTELEMPHRQAPYFKSKEAGAARGGIVD